MRSMRVKGHVETWHDGIHTQKNEANQRLDHYNIIEIEIEIVNCSLLKVEKTL